MPDRRGDPPAWGAKPFPKGDRSGRFVALASGREDDVDALPIRTDARVLGASLKAGESTEYRFAKGRYGYLVPSKGRGRRQRRRDRHARRRGDPRRGDDTVTAHEDAELVLVDSAP